MKAVLALFTVLLIAGCTSDPAPDHAVPPTAQALVLEGCPSQGTQSTSPSALPDLQLSCLGGSSSEVPLRRLTGAPTVLNLWASWCGPCRQEMPAFARLSTDAGSTLRVVGVASRDIPGNSIEYAGQLKLPYPSLQDENGDLLRGLRRVGLPVTVLLRADGSVADVYQGAPLTDTTLRALVRSKLGVDV